MSLLIQVNSSLTHASELFIAIGIGFTTAVTLAPIAWYNANRLVKRERSKLNDISPKI